jgi:single-strand DNA-binding protein
MNLNKAQVIGRVTRDPELKSLPSGTQACSFSVASNRVWYDKDKQKQEETEFHNIVAFGKDAETIAQYVEKGQELYVEGRLKTQSWEDKDSGKKMYRTEIIVDRFQFGQKAGSKSSSARDDDREDEEDIGDINPEDIPF